MNDRFHALKIILVDVAIILSIVMALDHVVRDFVFFRPERIQADFSENATDVLGQIDGAETPYFTSGYQDNQYNARFLALPYGMALDAIGHRLFVVSNFGVGAGRVSVYELDSSNGFAGTDRVADKIIGQVDFKGIDTGATANLFAADLWALVYDPGSNLLYAADRGNMRILVFNVGATMADITNGMDASYVLGRDGFTDGGFVVGLSDHEFDWGGGFVGQLLAIDSDNERLFVADNDNDRVLVFDVSMANLDSEANGVTDGISINADFVLGQEDFISNGLNATRDGMALPSGVAFMESGPQDLLYVADSENHRVLLFDVTPGTIANGMDALNVIGQEDDGDPFDSGLTCNDRYGQAGADCFDFPVGVETDGASRLFVVERDYSRIMVFDLPIADGDAAVNVLGQEDLTSSGVGNAADQLDNPHAAIFDGTSDTLFVLDSYNARVVTYDVGTIDIDDGEDAVDGVGILDENDEMAFGVTATVNAQGLYSPSDIFIDTADHRMFVTDQSNNRVLVFDLDSSNELIDHTADMVLGQPDFHTNTANVSREGLTTPQGLAYDPTPGQKRLFVADQYRVLVFDADPGTMTNGESALKEIGQIDDGDPFDSGDPCPFLTYNDSCFSGGIGVTLDVSAQRLFVADGGANRVLVFDANPDTMTDGEAAVGVIGQFDDGDPFDSADTCTSGGWSFPLSGPSCFRGGNGGLSFDAARNYLFVSDYAANRILVFDVQPGFSNGSDALFELGQVNDADPFDSVDDCGGTLAANCLSVPYWTFFNPLTNLLYVSDGGYSRLLVFDVATITNGEDAVEAYGVPDFETVGTGAATASTFVPCGISFGSNLWVVDCANNRVMIFGSAPVATPTPGGGGSQPPIEIGFVPDAIVINNDDAEVDGFNVLVNVNAEFTDDFTGTIDVLLSNTADFSTTIPFRYVVTNQTDRDSWPKTIAWNLCFGLPDNECDIGRKTVYARFYVNLPAVQPAITPLETPGD